MKRLTFTIFCMMMAIVSFAGGLLTNSNQSTQYVRTLSRNASTGIDATYYNPAGLSKLENGLYLSLHNQSIFQTKTVTNDFFLLNQNTFEGSVSAPLFPSGFAVYKMDKLAFSLGFGPNAGGGSATFEKGLPSFEIGVAQNIPALSALSALGYPVEAYDADIFFEGSSIFWGIQLGITYEINDMISVYGGARFVPARNTYTGYLNDIQYGPNGGLQNGMEYITGAAGTAAGTANLLGQTATMLDPLIGAGGGPLTIAQATGLGLMDAATAGQLQGGLLQLGVSQAQIDAMNFNQIQGTFTQASTELETQALYLGIVAGQMGDKTVDVEQTGFGISPILGLNLSPMDNLNIGVKYEFITKLELENNTTKDDTGTFPDGKITPSDIPAILAVGIEYGISSDLVASVSYNQYFDKAVDWGGKEDLIDHGLWEAGVSLEYHLSDKFLCSAGVLHSETGVMPEYQTDLSYSNTANTVGLGVEFKVNDKITLNLGGLNTFYVENQKEYTVTGFPDAVTESYTKSTMAFSLGVDILLF